MSAALTLFVDAGYASPWAMSVYVGLLEKGLDFELVPVDIAPGAARDPRFLACAPTGRVPTLRHDGFALAESSAITEYLDEVFDGPPLYPRDPRERAVARQLQAWIRSDLGALRGERPTEVIFVRPVDAPLSPAARLAADRLLAVADGLLAHGRGQLFERWCIADLDLALMLQRLLANGDAVPPRLADHARGQWARPAARRWVEMQRPG